MVDAEKVAAQGAAAVQLRTGGFCHLDASMVDKGLNNLDSAKLDLVIVENAGNLVCPAAFIIKSDKTVKSRLVWGRDPFLR
jgi:hydrogenase nickel incorporation protein HypB